MYPAATGGPVPEGQLDPDAEELAAFLLVARGPRLVQPAGEELPYLQDVTDVPHHGHSQVYYAGVGCERVLLSCVGALSCCLSLSVSV